MARAARWLVPVAALACVHPGADSGPAGLPAPDAAPGPLPEVAAPLAAAPEISIGVRVAVPRVELAADGPVAVTGADGAPLATLPGGARWTAAPLGAGLSVAGPGAPARRAPRLELAPVEPGGVVWVNGVAYPGRVTLLRSGAAVTAVNRVDLETYVAGVVVAELGRRDSTEFEALKAQAVVARTYAIRNRGRWAAQGFDLQAGVADQVYGGATAEGAPARAAAAATRGEVLTWQGEPIDAFFFSTCGGHTEDGPAVFARSNGAYLRGVPDLDGAGQAWCRASPRFRWREAWTGAELRATFRRTLPAVAGIAAARVTAVRAVRVEGRTPSGRARALAVTLPSGAVEVPGPRLREALRAPSGELLRSALVTLEPTVRGRQVTALVAEGSGSGHGVGLCQWGAIGRARAGHGYRAILAAYYQGVTLERRY